MYDAIGLPVSWAFETDCAYGDFIGSRIAAADGAAQAPDIGQRACVGRTGWLEQDRTLGRPAIGSGSADRPTARQAGDVGYEQGLTLWRWSRGCHLQDCVTQFFEIIWRRVGLR